MIIFDMYTVYNNTVKKVFSSGMRSTYILLREEDNTYKIAFNGASSAAQNEVNVYTLENGELKAVKSVKYDAQANENDPWSLGVDSGGTLVYTQTDEATATQTIKDIEAKYAKPSYTDFKK